MTQENLRPLDSEITDRLLATRRWARMGKAALYRGQPRSLQLEIKLWARRITAVIKPIPVLGPVTTVAVRVLRKSRNVVVRVKR